MQDSLQTIIETVRNYKGLLRKRPIKEIYKKLGMTAQYGNQLPNYGEDAAVIPWQEGYLLLAADGMITQLLVNEPYAAGKASVMVTVNDIYAMGGTPRTALNLVAFPLQAMDLSVLRRILQGGMDKLAEAGAVLIGGHSIEDNELKYGLAVTGLVHPERILRNSTARPGDRLVLTKPLGTGALVALGCHLCQKCYTGKCNWGIATQDPYLTKRLNPNIGSRRLANLIRAWSLEIKEMLGGMGVNAIESLRGNRDHLRGLGRGLIVSLTLSALVGGSAS